MTFSGWIYENGIIPWTKCLDVSIKQNSSISSPLSEAQHQVMIKCDLYGYSYYLADDSTECFYEFIDQLFRWYGCNLKACGNELEHTKVNDVSIYHPTQQYMQMSSAQVTVIDEAYVYFNMTSYRFWNKSNEFNKMLRETFHADNLGGYIVRIGAYPEIDDTIKEIL